MALVDHAKLAVFCNGVALKEVTSITFTTNSGQQVVETLEGLAGFTPGSGQCTLSISLGVPITGQEADFQQWCAEGAYVTMQIPVGSKSYSGSGKLMTATISQSVNANTEESVEWTGELGKLQ